MYVFKFKRSVKKETHCLTMLLLIAVCLVGFLLGVLFFRKINSSFLENSDFIFHSYMKPRFEYKFTALFLQAFSSCTLFLLFFGFMGFSALGAYVIPVLPFLKAFILGANLSHVCCLYGIKGALWNLIVIFPGAYAAFLILLFAAKESIGFSGKIRRCVFKGSELSSHEVRLYCRRLCLSVILLLIPSLADGLLAVLFAGVFAFD